jgi:hypothetical protein
MYTRYDESKSAQSQAPFITVACGTDPRAGRGGGGVGRGSLLPSPSPLLPLPLPPLAAVWERETGREIERRLVDRFR